MLENHHIAAAFKLLSADGADWTRALSVEQYRVSRVVVVVVILLLHHRLVVVVVLLLLLLTKASVPFMGRTFARPSSSSSLAPT